MPKVELCIYCLVKINSSEEYVIISLAHERDPQKLAHAKCHAENARTLQR